VVGPAALVAAFSGAPTASAAELSWAAPPECARALDVRDQVERLLGRDLASVEGMDFSVAVRAEGEPQRWSLELRSRTASEQGARDFSGASCEELVDAVAIAIAMAVEGRDEAEAENAHPEVETETAAPEAVSEAPAPEMQAPAPVDRALEPVRPQVFDVLLALGVAADAGALPGPSAGAELEASLGFGGFRLTALAALYAERSATIEGDRGGDFSLALAGLLGCVRRGPREWQLLGCGGAELGWLSGEGAVTRAKLGGQLWSALRAEVGAVLPVAGDVGLEARVGAALPLVRRDFVVDGDDLVHRPAALAGRGFLGIFARL
jgi:hypothetical protein